jgi:hypothetical protein
MGFALPSTANIWIVMNLSDCLLPARFCHEAINALNYEGQHANGGLVCALEGCQLCAEPSFAGAEVSEDGRVPRTGTVRYRNNDRFMKGRFNISASSLTFNRK